MREVLLLLLVGLAAAGSRVLAQEVPPQQVVEHFLDACNRHDVDAMLEFVHPEIQWCSLAAERP